MPIPPYKNQLLAVYSESNNGPTFATVCENKSEKEIVMDFMDWIATFSHDFYAACQDSKIKDEIISALRFEGQNAPKATSINNVTVFSNSQSPQSPFWNYRLTMSYSRPLDLRSQEYKQTGRLETPVLKLAIHVPSYAPLGAAGRTYTLILTGYPL